jgi:hypothetical protein
VPVSEIGQAGLVAYPGQGVYEFARWGHVAEWLRNGLQNRVHQFNSGRGLHSILSNFSRNSFRFRSANPRFDEADRKSWAWEKEHPEPTGKRAVAQVL